MIRLHLILNIIWYSLILIITTASFTTAIKNFDPNRFRGKIFKLLAFEVVAFFKNSYRN